MKIKCVTGDFGSREKIGSEMDLLGQVLIRLPLQRLVELHASESSVPDSGRVISTRLLTVRIEKLRPSKARSLIPCEIEFTVLDPGNESFMLDYARLNASALQNYLPDNTVDIQQETSQIDNVLRIPSPELDCGGKTPSKASTRTADYLRMFTLGGELTIESQIHVQVDALLERALFLGDVDAFYYYAGIYPLYPLLDSDSYEVVRILTNPLLIQRVLEVGNPKITAIALALAVNTKEIDNLFPIDRKSIKWTSALRLYYENLCWMCFTGSGMRGGEFFVDAANLAGYLQIWPLDDLQHLPSRLLPYLSNYVDSYVDVERSKPGFDPKAIVRTLTRFRSIERWSDSGLVILPSGTIFASRNPTLLSTALREILPEVAQELLAAGATLSDQENPLLLVCGRITRTIVQNAHRMLALLAPSVVRSQAPQGFPEGMAELHGIPRWYLTYLRVLCGLPIGKEELLSILEDESQPGSEILSEIIAAMIATMHPNLPKNSHHIQCDISFSTVQYNAEHFVKVYKGSNKPSIINVYRYGLGWMCQGHPDCIMSSAQVRHGIPHGADDIWQIRSVEEIVNIEAMSRRLMSNREGLLSNAKVFREHVETFCSMLNQ